MNRQNLLDILPPSNGIEKVIVEDQTVRDIVKEVLAAHAEFAPDYDLICEEFARRSYALEGIFDFCKYNLRNDTEGEDLQTTASPTVLLEKGHCDCKGYAGFIGGILDGLNRAGRKYNWCYRFAEYDQDGETHYHVFIVVKEQGEEIWIDPVLSYFNCKDPEPDRFFDRKKTTMTLVRMSGMNYQRGNLEAMGCDCAACDSTNSKMGSHYDANGKLVLDPCDWQPQGCTNASAATYAAEQQNTYNAQLALYSVSNSIGFKETRAGLLLPSIPGYPADLPRLQISPSGRLCFYDWPLTFHLPLWTDFKTTLPLAVPLSTLNYPEGWQRIGTKEIITSAQCKVLQQDYNNGAGPALYDWCVATGPNSIFKVGRPRMWIMENIQYYLNKYLNNPYRITDLIPYGTNWDEQLFDIITNSDQNKLANYLGNCNFLVQPVGTKTFWDKFYLAAPLVISAIAAIVTEGAATPALLLALGNLGIKAGEAKAAQQSAAIPIQGAPSINVKNVTTDINTLTGNTTLSASGLMTWIKDNPLPAAGIGGALLLILYGLLSND